MNTSTITQTPRMKGRDLAVFKRDFTASPAKTVALVVAGGQFTEAEEFATGVVTGAIVIGPCLPPPDFEREAIRLYHARRGEDGAWIAYFQPAIRRVVQAAGRVIRSESDRGIILLTDDRFLEEPFLPLLPDLWKKSLARQSGSWQEHAAEFWETDLPPASTKKSLSIGRRRGVKPSGRAD